MMRALSYFREIMKNDKGAAAVEFALIGPVLAFLLVGIIDYGMYAHEQMELQALSRRAAEYVIHGGSEADVETAIFQASDYYIDAGPNRTSVDFDGQIVCACADGVEALDCSSVCPDSSDYLRSFYAVTITAVYTPLLPYPGIADGVTLTGYSKLQYAR